MNIKLFIIIITCILMVSCLQNPKPKNLISKEEFTSLLVDLHLTDAILGDQRKSITDLQDISPAYYHYVFKKYSITRQQFDEAIVYYAFDQEVIDEIYTNVIIKIREIQKSDVASENETPTKE